MKLPIDTGSVKFAAAGPAEPVFDYETKAAKLDESGAALFAVPLFAIGTGIRDSIAVKVTGDVKGLREFTSLKVTKIAANTLEAGTNL